MKSKRYNFAVEKAIYTAYLDISEFTACSKEKQYHEYVVSVGKRIENYSMNLKEIRDLFLRRRLIEFFLYCMDNKILNAESFFVYRVRALKRTLSESPDLYNKPYEDFITSSLTEMNLKYAKCNYIIAFLHTFEKYCYNQDFIDRKFDKDIWDLNDYSISFERNASLRFKHLSFQKIINPTNKYYIKKYIEYCLCNTDNTINTICGRLACLKFMFTNSETAYDKWTDNDSETFIHKLIDKYPNKRTLASRMITYYHFTNFLLLHDFLSTNPLKKFHGLCAVGTFRHSTIAVDDETISQIFRILGKIQNKSIVLIFLLIYCVGMRVSEACTITSDCLEKTSEGEFIKYYSLKMKKEVCNVIPLALYEMIYEYRNNRALNSKYLFPSSKRNDIPISTSNFTKRLNDEFEKYNITNADATPYRFKPHAFRHKMAVNMRRLDIPFQIIQEQLHHASPEMTLAYVEYIDRDIIRKMDDFIDSHGKKNNNIIETIQSENKEYADYMRRSINAQLLPNGLCARPLSLGKCCHENTCLTCPEYRTSKAYLEVHKKHLQKVEEYIKIAEQNGWLPQVESSKQTIQILNKIISELENSEETI